MFSNIFFTKKYSTLEKFLIFLFLFYAAKLNFAFADDSSILFYRLNKIENFYSTFLQQNIDIDGKVIQESKGEFWMKRPNLFNWHVVSPDENFLISDGKTLWFYNLLVEQVTINSLENVIQNTPFLLITCNIKSEWNKYNIKKDGDNFFLTPKKDDEINIKTFLFKIDKSGTIQKITIIDQEGSKNNFYLKNQNTLPINSTKFFFTPPPNTTLDDQR